MSRDEMMELFPPLECFNENCGAYLSRSEEPLECDDCCKFLCEDCALRHNSGRCDSCEELANDNQEEIEHDLSLLRQAVELDERELIYLEGKVREIKTDIEDYKKKIAEKEKAAVKAA